MSAAKPMHICGKRSRIDSRLSCELHRVFFSRVCAPFPFSDLYHSIYHPLSVDLLARYGYFSCVFFCAIPRRSALRERPQELALRLIRFFKPNSTSFPCTFPWPREARMFALLRHHAAMMCRVRAMSGAPPCVCPTPCLRLQIVEYGRLAA